MALKRYGPRLSGIASTTGRFLARRLRSTARWVRRRSRRSSALAALAVLLVAGSVWLVSATLASASDARGEVSELIDQSTSLSLAGLLEPGTYARLAEQSGTIAVALESVDSRLDFFDPVEFLPFVGGRVKAARNTVEVGRDVSFAARVVLTAYAAALDGRAREGRDSITTAFAQQRAELDEALAALHRAEGRTGKATVLSEREEGLLTASIAVLRSMAVVALDAPTAVDDGFELLGVVNDLQDLVGDPFRALNETEEVRELVDALRLSAARLTERLSRLATEENEGVLLALDGLAVAEAVSEAAGDLLGIADAVELGLFSVEFGAAVGPKLLSAEDRLREADLLLDELRDELAGGIGGGVVSGEPGGVFAPIEEALADTSDSVSTIRLALGYEGQRTYLLLLQNQNEIRATGGFIGATAELPLTNGVLGPLVFEDSTRVDIPPLINNPPAPEPLFWYLWAGRLLFRDANWNPDFPTSAETLLDLYAKSRNDEVDGADYGHEAAGTGPRGRAGSGVGAGRGQADHADGGELVRRRVAALRMRGASRFGPGQTLLRRGPATRDHRGPETGDGRREAVVADRDDRDAPEA